MVSSGRGYVRLLLVCCLFCIDEASADAFIAGCSLKSTPRQALTLDSETGTYIVVEDENDGGGEEGKGGRSLQSSWFQFPLRRRVETTSNALHVKSATRSLQTKNDTNIIYARECECYSKIRPAVDTVPFCVERFDACGIPADLNLPVGCFGMSQKTVLVRNAWPVVILWYAAMGIFMLFTEQGRHARYFVISKCCNPNFNRELLERYWYTEGGYWRLRQRRGWFRGGWGQWRRRPNAAAAAATEQAVPPLPQSARPYLNVDLEGAEHHHHAPNQLALKTKRYEASGAPLHDEADDTACAICFSPLEDGDRVGALQCNHTFHVDCLKTWLKRRNVCPLCQTPDVATPRYQPGYESRQEIEEQEESAEEAPSQNPTVNDDFPESLRQESTTIEMTRRETPATAAGAREDDVDRGRPATSRAFGSAYQLHQRR